MCTQFDVIRLCSIMIMIIKYKLETIVLFSYKHIAYAT